MYSKLSIIYSYTAGCIIYLTLTSTSEQKVKVLKQAEINVYNLHIRVHKQAYSNNNNRNQTTYGDAHGRERQGRHHKKHKHCSTPCFELGRIFCLDS